MTSNPWLEPSASSASCTRVLVVDDDEHVLIIVRALLLDAGYEVQVAGDGFEGLDVARAFRPDIVVSDLQMPRMGGLEFRREAFQDPNLTETPFLFITAYQESLETLVALLHPEDRALLKPIDPTELLGIVKILTDTGSRS